MSRFIHLITVVTEFLVTCITDYNIKSPPRTKLGMTIYRKHRYMKRPIRYDPIYRYRTIYRYFRYFRYFGTSLLVTIQRRRDGKADPTNDQNITPLGAYSINMRFINMRGAIVRVAPVYGV